MASTKKSAPAGTEKKKRERKASDSVYLIGSGDKMRLVNATTKKAAIAHVLGDVSARKATMQDIFNGAKAGLEIENASAQANLDAITKD